MAQLADSLLNKIFQTSNISLFLNEYEKYSKEFGKTLESYLQLAEGQVENDELTEESYSVDFFYEYMRPFVTKKPRVYLKPFFY